MFIDFLNSLLWKKNKLKEISKKTPEIHLQMARIQFLASLYVEEGRIVIPSGNVFATLIAGAKLRRKGMDIIRSVVFPKPYYPLKYDGVKDPDKLWDDKTFVDIRPAVISRSKVMACRARFMEWELESNVVFDDLMLDPKVFERAVEDAGRYCGLGTYRRLFGRFESEVIYE